MLLRTGQAEADFLQHRTGALLGFGCPIRMLASSFVESLSPNIVFQHPERQWPVAAAQQLVDRVRKQRTPNTDANHRWIEIDGLFRPCAAMRPHRDLVRLRRVR